MQRRLAFLWLALIVLPIHGEKNSTQPRSNQTDGKNNPDWASKSPALNTADCTIKQDGTTIECQWAKGEPERYLTRLFSPENTPNVALFFVGLGGIGVAICTLWRIERQTIATEIAARATRKSADIAANAGRAWLVPEVRFNPRLHDYAQQGLPEVSCMIVIMKNFGVSPAEISRAKIVAVLMPKELALPTEPLYDELEVAAIEGEVVAPQAHAIATVRIRHHVQLAPEELREVSRREQRLICYGRIEYTDNTGRKRVTQFGYEYYARTGPQDDRPEAMYRAFGKAFNFSV